MRPPATRTDRRAPASTALSGPLAALLLLAAGCSGAQQFAPVGDLPTAGGEPVRDCKIGYRTFGALDAARSNAVLMTLWHLGRSAEARQQLWRKQLVDTSRYFVIVVDPIGNGVSCSPSNSAAQPGARFPRVGIDEMVESQHRLLTQVLGLHHLHAVVGTSMGGMQALTWATAHPGFMDVTVAVAGSPRTLPFERDRWRLWTAQVRASGAPAHWWERFGLADPHDPEDYALQSEAIAAHDLSARFGDSLEAAAAAVQSRLVLVVTPRDPVVDPGPARDFARLAHAQLRELDPRCGHQAPSCEVETLRRFIGEALEGGAAH